MTALRVHYGPGQSLIEYARHWADMVPHLATLTRFASECRTVVEFGVRGGVSTWALLDGLPRDGRLVAVDTDPDVRFMAPPWVLGDPRLTLVIGDDRKVRLPKSADLVLIDTTHEREQTAAELRIAARLRPARIACHDWNAAGVREAVEAFCTAGKWRVAGVEESPWGLAWLERAS